METVCGKNENLGALFLSNYMIGVLGLLMQKELDIKES